MLSLHRVSAREPHLSEDELRGPGLEDLNSLDSTSNLAPLSDSAVSTYRSSSAGLAFWCQGDTTLAAVAMDGCSERLVVPDQVVKV